MLGNYFQQQDHSVIHAEGDADTVLVKKALERAQEELVTVVADDTDILILRLYHSSKNILMQSATQADKVRDIEAMKICIGENACKALPFVHALTGCDTTSALYGKSKTSAFKKITNSELLCNIASQFGSCEDVTKKDLIEVGSKVIVSLNGGKTNGHLNILRYEEYMRKIASAKKKFDIARLPPTQSSAKYHNLLRVYLQCFIWKNLHIMPTPDPTQFGWQFVAGAYQPVLTDMDMCPAPDKVQSMINCSCHTSLWEPCSSMKCTCRRYGLACSIVCNHGCGKDCTNGGETIFDDEEEDQI